jgi:CheY-like chemotaxis protein
MSTIDAQLYAARYALPRRRVLVADDNVDSAASLSLLLRHTGHETHVAYDGSDALEAAERLRPEVALLDIGMPQLNGYEVARRIRQQAWGVQMTLVAVTGWGQDDDKRRAEDAGFDYHLTKPLDYATLRKILESPRIGHRHSASGQ